MGQRLSEGGAGFLGAPGRGSSEPMVVQITHKRVTTGKDFWDALIDDPSLKRRVEDQVGRQDRSRVRAFCVEPDSRHPTRRKPPL